MAPLSLKIILEDGAVTRKVKFDSRTTVREAYEIVKDKVIVPEGQVYGFFLRSPDDDRSGVWLESHRALDYYMLRDGDSLDYICKNRILKIKLLDGSMRTLKVDESKPVGELMMTVCGRIGITNYDEYGLCHEMEIDEEEKPKETSIGTLTLKRLRRPKERDLEHEVTSKRLKTDDYVEWLDQHKTLRELGVDPAETLILKRRLFYSDRNVDSRDPVQLNLLYVETRDAILIGKHPVTEAQAAEFGGIQCQVQFGDYQSDKHKTGFIENLQEYLPESYCSRSVEKKILKAWGCHQTLSPLEAKHLYTKTARELPTYGVTFFLVKEQQKGKKKLVPRLLGINAESILRLDEVTKEILQQWPLTHVKSYHLGKSDMFTLNFGDYSDKEYSVKTQDAYRIRDILEGYIDIIRKRMFAKYDVIVPETSAIGEECVEMSQGNVIQCIANNPSKLVTESFVGPSGILPHVEGSTGSHSAQIITVQQLIVSNQGNKKQETLKGEVPLRGDMSLNCVRKLNRLNSNSVKIVTLLTDPTETNIKDAQRVVENMHEDLPIVVEGVKETAGKQSNEDARKTLLDELQDLVNYMTKLAETTKPEDVDPVKAKDTAENIAGLTTQMYFSLDPKTRRRSELVRMSRNSFIAGEKTDATIRRASFIASASTALSSIDNASFALEQDYKGPKLDTEEQRKLEKTIEDRICKLNAALALYMAAHSDGQNIDYPAAIGSMNTINELMPDLANDIRILANSKDPKSRKELLEDMGTLFASTRKLCALSGSEDHEKMHEASNQYADVAGKLIFTFSRGAHADKENEIIEKAKDVAEKSSLLLMGVNDLTSQCPSDSHVEELHNAGVKTAGATRDLLATAQLTAAAIHEPHCRSALTASAEGLASSIQHLASSWKPLTVDPSRQYLDEGLHSAAMQVAKALDALKECYENYDDVEMTDADDSKDPRGQRLKFINSASGAQKKLIGLEDMWDAKHNVAPLREEDKKAAQKRLAQMIAQLNAAVAALATANGDRENPDYANAEMAMGTIAELLPQIVKDADAVSFDGDEKTRREMQQQIKALCETSRALCAGAERPENLSDAANSLSAATRKLLFIVSPDVDKFKERQISDASTGTYGKAAELVSLVHQLGERLPTEDAATLNKKEANTMNCAEALVTAAKVTGPSISEARCQSALSSSMDQLRNSANDMVATCYMNMPQKSELREDVADAHKELENSLKILEAACKLEKDDNSASSQNREKQRLKFVNSVSSIKKRFDAMKDVPAPPCALMTEEDGIALQNKLANKLAQLNAAIAALNRAVADRETPDYVAADAAIKTISELMPEIAQDSRTLCSTKDGKDQADMIRQLQDLCDASQAICISASSPEGLSDLSDAAKKYSEASGRLKFFISPAPDSEEQKRVMDLSALACGTASELLSHVQRLTEQVGGDDAVELDRKGALTADAAQALLNTAEVTTPTINYAQCQKELISSAKQLGTSANDLKSACNPHLQQNKDLQKRVEDSNRNLQDILESLVGAIEDCNAPAVQEKQKLKFINSASAARNRLKSTEQKLTMPVTSAPIKEDHSILQRDLSGKLAQLNAAIAALNNAIADQERPNYAEADKAIKTIAELMPQVVQDSRVLVASKTKKEQAAMMEELKKLCNASDEILASTATPGDISKLRDASAKYADASGHLKFIISPAENKVKEGQILDQSALACGRASELLSHVHRLTEQVGGDAAVQLNRKGAHTADSAQTLLNTAKITAPTMQEAHCQQALLSSIDHLGKSANELKTACGPHLHHNKTKQLQNSLLDSHKQLQETLQSLAEACKDSDPSVAQERQRLKFINSAAEAKNGFEKAQKQFNVPVPPVRAEDRITLQNKLSDKLARLNGAIAALNAAIADRDNPDYTTANEAIQTISDLMPQVVQDSRKLGTTKDVGAQEAMTEQLKNLCDASHAMYNSAISPEDLVKLSDAASKYSAASGKLKFLISPAEENIKESQILDLSALACGRASELLSHVHRLTEQIGGDAAVQLDKKGAYTADAAQTLLNTAQITASTILEPLCQKSLLSSASHLGTSAEELTTACSPYLKHNDAKTKQLQNDLQNSHKQLQDSLKMLTNACKDSPMPQEQQKLKFINSVCNTYNCLEAAEKQLQQPVPCSFMKEEDAVALQNELSQKVSRLNAAVAALKAAIANHQKPDYVAADGAIKTIAELMPQVVQETRTTCSFKDDETQKQMMQQLKALCDASRAMCSSVEKPQDLNAATAKFTDASGKLIFLVSPTQEKPRTKTKPSVPVRSAHMHTVAQAAPAGNKNNIMTQDFLDRLRFEESQAAMTPVVKITTKTKSPEEKLAYQEFANTVNAADKDLLKTEKDLEKLYNIKKSSAPVTNAAEVAKKEEKIEETLAKAGVEVAALVAANYADKMDYKAATKPTAKLPKLVKSVVEYGSVVSTSLNDRDRKAFLDDMLGLCQSTRKLCGAAKDDKEKLNNTAIEFGNHSAKLLRVVSTDVNSALEKELISRAKAIGDTASRLALEVGNVANTGVTLNSGEDGVNPVQDICAAGTSCVDAAGKLVYTAKCVAPTIHHSTCQESLVSSADTLSKNLEAFSKTWKPISDQPSVKHLTEEARNLEKLLEELRRDVKAGKLGRKWESDAVIVLDTPLKKMTQQIIEDAKNMAECTNLKPEQKTEYTNYARTLEEALRALDLANARCQRSPHDKKKRHQLEETIQDLQVALLQSRPKRAGKEQNNVVDLRDFLQDIESEAEQLRETAKKNEIVSSKQATETIKSVCTKISGDTKRLMNPGEHPRGEDTTLDDILEFDTFGQDCDQLLKEINDALESIKDEKTKRTLRNKTLPLIESCNMLRFATCTAISTAQGAAFDGTLNDLDDFESTVLKSLVEDVAKNAGVTKRSQVAPSLVFAQQSRIALQQAACAAAAGDPRHVPTALAHYAAHAAAQPGDSELAANELFSHLCAVTTQVKMVTGTGSVRAATWDAPRQAEVAPGTTRLINELNQSPIAGAKQGQVHLLKDEDLHKLLLPSDGARVEGTKEQLQERLQQLSTKLSSMSSMILVSLKKPESLARSLKATSDVALQLAPTARALQEKMKPVERKRIEEATREMCFSTYSLLRTSEMVCNEPDHPESRRKLLDACRLLNDAINKLVRSAKPEVSLDRECSELARSIQLQQSAAQGGPRASGALPYADCVDTLKDQQDIIHKLNNEQGMSKQEFLNNLTYITSAVNNSSDCAAHCAYLLSVSESHESAGKNGVVDVPKLHKMVSSVHDSCIGIIKAGNEEQVKEEKKDLEVHIRDLLKALDEASEKTKAEDLKSLLKHCRDNLDRSAKSLCKTIDRDSPKSMIISDSLRLLDDLNRTATVIDHPKLVPNVEAMSTDTQALCEDVQKNTRLLLSKTQDLIREVKTSPEEPEVMKWVMFNKRKDVLEAFEALLKSVRSSGQRVRFLETTVDEAEGEQKTYVQIQVETAFKWLKKPMCKADVKSAGKQSVVNIISIAKKMVEDLKGGEKEELTHLISETEQLLKDCSGKYDHEQYSMLMDRVKELQKSIERGVVTRVVEDFMEVDTPLADLDILADAEKDEKKRQLILKKKIDELLAHLNRVNRTARFIAETGSGGKTLSNQLTQCSQQTELLAPMLVKAAETRIHSPDDQAAIDHYRSLVAKYAESLARVRDLCDQSVDPMDFVQTAGEKMQRMREESTAHNDPLKCAYTSTAINRLANRVIHVGLSSSSARADPELQRALTAAQTQLQQATPAPDTRASKMPDWKDTTAKILRATEEVESVLGGENIFKKQPEPNQPIYNEALNLHVAIRDWSSRDNEIVAVAKRMAVLMAKLSDFMNRDKQRELLVTSKSIVTESHEVARLAKKLAHECTDMRIKNNLLQACERIPTISGQLKMLTTVKGSSLGHHGTHEDKEAMDMLVGNAQSLMISIQDVVKAAASASVKIMSQRGPRMKWVRKTYY